MLNADNYPSTGQGLLGNNTYAYCNNNPVIRKDSTGTAFETVWDVVSLVASIADVAENPRDPWAWAGLAGDLLDVVIPCVGGIGEITRAGKYAKALGDAVDTASDVKKGWKVGDDITNLTKAGNKPSWTTVRNRYWKNEAALNPAHYSNNDLVRMKKGLAPQIEVDGLKYSKELHHKVPRHKGGSDAYSNLVPVWPWEHAEIDVFRHF